MVLIPYRKQWPIQGRVHGKIFVHSYNNDWGFEKVFGFELIDFTNDTIHLSDFGNLKDSLHDLLQIGILYMVSNGIVKPANTKLNHLDIKSEFYISATCVVEPSLDDVSKIRFHCFHFKYLDEIIYANLGSIIDIICIVSSISPTSPICRRDGSKTPRKIIILEDMSSYSIEITLWTEHCHTLIKQLIELTSSSASTLLAIKRSCIAEFNGRTVGTISTMSFMLDPAIPKAK